jgi:hypothetical protein
MRQLSYMIRTDVAMKSTATTNSITRMETVFSFRSVS